MAPCPCASPCRPCCSPCRADPQARLRRQAQALHLHRRARAAARVDPRLRRHGVRPPRRRVGGDDVPRRVFRRMGELGFLGLDKPERVRRRGRRLLRVARARRGDRARAVAAAWRWGSRCTPTWRCRRSSRSAPRSRSRSGSCPRSRARRSSASASPSPTPAPTSPASRRAPSATATTTSSTAPRRYITNGHRADVIVLVTKTDPDAGYDGFTLFLVPMDAPGVIREKKLEKLGMHASDTALLAFQDVRVPSTRGPRPGRQGLLPHHVGAPGRAPDRRRRLRRPAPSACFELTLQYAKERTAFGRQIGKFQVIRHKFAEMATKIESARADGLHDRLAPPERRVPRARDLDGEAATRRGSRSRSPTSASRSTAAPAT